ncbi:hypothetical protein BDB00DRAFT_924605 [Zychaea mexicana]|uniref:uncharacterized protein n=1 Tax=Zychaea mexicana TaxID=64656 RepID=UPI0022FE7A5C|nr:uncharacterized protein BDB00DRAFT_924605 [Zychaea mexicana]KAI9499359.1 hypothetical protein BDB00DRAFT_924605 [Zychaea mexicana]
MLNVFDEYAIAWLNIGTLIFIPFFITLAQLRTVIQSSIASAQLNAQHFCREIDHAASQVANIPHIMLEDSIKASRAVIDSIARQLIFMVQALEEIILWIIGAYKSMYRCLLGLAVNGAISAVTKIAGPVQQAAESILTGLDKGTSIIGHLISGDNDEDVADNSVQLGNWTSTMQDVQNKVQNWTTNGADDPFDLMIRQPFEKIKQQIHDNVVTWKPDNVPTAFTAQQQQLQSKEFCDLTAIQDGLNSVQQKLLTVTNIIIVLIVVAALTCIVVNVLWVRFRHTYTSRRIRDLAFTLVTLQHKSDELRSERKSIEQKLESLGHANRKPVIASIITNEKLQRRPVLAWWFDYLTHPVVFYCFLTGILGLMMTFVASATMHQILENNGQFNTLVQHWATDQSGSAAIQALSHIESQANTLNQWIASSEASINEHTFGAIRSIALSANDTIGLVTDHISDFVKLTLGGTVLEEPAKDVLDCLFMTKIEQLENGLTWIAQNTYVNLTRVSALDAKNSVERSFYAISSVSDLLSVVQKQVDSKLQQDIMLYSIVLSLWGFCLCIAMVLQFQKYIKK